jgi:hypothetical protein
MLTWDEFQQTQPEHAAAGRAMLYQFGVGLGYLGTVRADGGPRVHPICPILTDSALYTFLVASPKRSDLHRDPRYALHAFPVDGNEDAFYVTGAAAPRPDPELREVIAAQYFGERDMAEAPAGFEEEQLFELLIGSCLVTRTKGHGDWDPQHAVWTA